MLAWSPVLWLGRISYSLYMSHLLVLIVLWRILPAGVTVQPALGIPIAIVACLLCAAVMLHAIEEPARRTLNRRNPFKPPQHVGTGRLEAAIDRLRTRVTGTIRGSAGRVRRALTLPPAVLYAIVSAILGGAIGTVLYAYFTTPTLYGIPWVIGVALMCATLGAACSTLPKKDRPSIGGLTLFALILASLAFAAVSSTELPEE
jgi:peptidoglycan/LPS O-acetylase OafA/YrhL